MSLSVHLLLTGDELMAGDIVDSNSAMIAQQLKQIGLVIQQKVTVGDNLSLLTQTIEQLSKQADVLIINGGLGPTLDDLTAQALAQASSQALAYHPSAINHLNTWCEQRGFKLNDANKKQALLPEQCEIIANPIGSAVGFKLKLNQCVIYCTPGVPKELELMLSRQIIPDLQQTFDDITPYYTDKFQVFGLGESNIQSMISTELSDWPKQLSLGFRATMPLIEVKISYQQQDKLLAEQYKQKIEQLLGEHIIGTENTNLAIELINALKSKNKTITCAESCTGGMISSEITQISGSSEVFHAGFVTYANHIKQQILNVPANILSEHGAVSKATVIAMLNGALKQSNADIGVAVSGIAGPNSDDTNKPVGMVWLAWGTRSTQHSCCLYIPFGRAYFQRFTSSVALDLCRRFVLELSESPHYLTQRAFKKGLHE